MNPSRIPKTESRNLSLDCCKMVAAILVIFLHLKFPGQVGEWFVFPARLAVPLFLAVSGWYSFRCSAAALARRLRHIVLLELTGSLLQILWLTFVGIYRGFSLGATILDLIPTGEELRLWLLFNVNPYAVPLWYLSAMTHCYGFLWIYRRFAPAKWGNRPLYILAMTLLTARFSMELSGAVWLPDYGWRNSILMGFPLFLLGMLLHEYRDPLLKRLHSRWLAAIVAAGILVSLLQRHWMGDTELFIGVVPAIAAVILLCQLWPSVPGWLQKPAETFAFAATWIYLLHTIVIDLYLGFAQRRVALLLGDAEAMIAPVVAAVSTVIGVYVLLYLKRKTATILQCCKSEQK